MSETTKTNEEKGRPRYNMFQNIGWMFRRAVRTSRWLLPMAGGQVFCGVALAMLELFCAPAVLRQVEGGAAVHEIVPFRLSLGESVGRPKENTH